MKAGTPTNRKEAIKNGLKTYHGKPCKNCGQTLKQTSGKSCFKCSYERNRANRLANPQKVLDAIKRSRHANPIREMVKNAKNRAEDKGLDFDITEQTIVQTLEACEYRCYYTGTKMTLETGNGLGNYNNLKVSIDRIDSKKGYVRSNIVLCCRIVNAMKSNLTVEEFLDWCRLIVANQATPYRAAPNQA